MLELDAVTIATPQRTLMRGLSARIGAGELLAVTGPSGSGKSSLLGYLSGTLADGLRGSGRVRLDGRDIAALPTRERRVGLLFQDDLLFPHLNVRGNVLFALPAGDAADRIAQADAALASAGLEGCGERLPHTLSGGQRARVSVLRALMAQPRALLLDEPFSRLDAPLRARFRAFVFERLAAMAIPAVLVTHDPNDIPAGAQRIELVAEGGDA